MATSTIQKNLPFLKSQFSAALGNSSVVVKFVCVSVFFCYFISYSHDALPYVTVTPGYVLPPNFWVWTYLTHSFMEFHIWNVIVDISVLVLYGKLLEPLWGALEMLIFYLLVNFGVAVLTSMVYVVIYLVTRNEVYLFGTYIHGLAGYLAGFSVAVKQIMPDHMIINSPFGKLRNRHIPVLLLIIAIIVRLIGGVDGPFPIMWGMGILVSWTYLRFYQKHSNGNRGDMAENFTFASFFPEPVQPVISVLSNTVFSALVKVKICKAPQRKYDVSSPTTITVQLPGTDPLDAERRRQLALKALNERLSKSSSEPPSWPSLEESAESPQSEKEPLLVTVPESSKPKPKPKEVRSMVTAAAEKEKSSPPPPQLPVPDFKEQSKAAAAAAAANTSSDSL